MVNDLSTMAKGSPSVQTGPAVQESTLRTLGLECLVTIMKSLVEWSKELVKEKEDKDSTSGTTFSPPPFFPFVVLVLMVLLADTESIDDAGERTPDRFEKKKHIKLQLETGKEKFNINATKVRSPRPLRALRECHSHLSASTTGSAIPRGRGPGRVHTGSCRPILQGAG